MSNLDRPHVFRRTPERLICECRRNFAHPIHVAARDVPREEEIEFGYPRPCTTCGRVIHRTAEHFHLDQMHGDRVGRGPLEFCSAGCLAIFAQHESDMEVRRANDSPVR